LAEQKIEGVILRSIDDPTPIIRTRVDTEASKGYEHIVSSDDPACLPKWGVNQDLKPGALGIGTPGRTGSHLADHEKLQYGCSLNGKPLLKKILKQPCS